jgi:hypothetical protein
MSVPLQSVFAADAHLAGGQILFEEAAATEENV